MTMTFREATVRDANQILGLYRDTMKELATLGGNEVSENDADWTSTHFQIRQLIRDSSSAVLVGVDGHKVVAYVFATLCDLEPPFVPKRILRVLSIYIVPKYRGGRTAHKLVHGVMDWGRECGASVAEADALMDNRSTLLLLKDGYAIMGQTLRKSL